MFVGLISKNLRPPGPGLGAIPVRRLFLDRAVEVTDPFATDPPAGWGWVAYFAGNSAPSAGPTAATGTCAGRCARVQIPIGAAQSPAPAPGGLSRPAGPGSKRRPPRPVRCQARTGTPLLLVSGPDRSRKVLPPCPGFAGELAGERYETASMCQ